MADDSKSVRVDKWLWAARFFKTRSLATAAVAGGKVEVNGERAKPAKSVKPGDEIRLRLPPYEHILIVRALAERRGPASVAQGLYEGRRPASPSGIASPSSCEWRPPRSCSRIAGGRPRRTAAN